MVAMYFDAEHKTWDTVLPCVVFAYNTVMQETVRMTPFSLVYVREAAAALGAMLPDITEANHITTYLSTCRTRTCSSTDKGTAAHRRPALQPTPSLCAYFNQS